MTEALQGTATRPVLHISAGRGWLNDPNGLLFHRGLWHQCFQNNPEAPEWGNLHWAHRVSRDLVHWEEWPCALSPQPDGRWPFSGSMVDAGEGRLAVFFTDHQSADESVPECVRSAWSTDGGKTFIRRDGKPHLVLADRKFGDPKVWWQAEVNKWCMVNIAGWPEQGRVVFAVSENLVDWEICSEFRAADVAPGVWECPELVRIPDGRGGKLDVLKVNTWDVPSGEKGTVYFTGWFDGRRFSWDERILRGPTPPGDPAYAEVAWNDAPDGRSVWSGWLRQEPAPEVRDWSGALWLPRELRARHSPSGIRLEHRPVPELSAARGMAAAFASGLEYGPCEMALEVVLADAVALHFPASDGSFVTLHLDADCARLDLPGSSGTPVLWAPANGVQHLRLWLDGPCLSVFVNDGDFAPNAILHAADFLGSVVPEVGTATPCGTVWPIKL